MRSHISASKAAARSFSEPMNRVRYRNESFIIERAGKPICEILPARSGRATSIEQKLIRFRPGARALEKMGSVRIEQRKALFHHFEHPLVGRRHYFIGRHFVGVLAQPFLHPSTPG